MATLKAIRKRISSIRNTQQITKAMKMVSAAKLRRAQEAAVRLVRTRTRCRVVAQRCGKGFPRSSSAAQRS